MTEVRLTSAAEIDLAEIWNYTFECWGHRQADAYIAEIGEALSGLSGNPRKGRDHSDTRPGYRGLLIGRHIAFYRILDTHISVSRVLHQSTDLPRQLNEQ